jgi:FtsH-binding integral membrane protein
MPVSLLHGSPFTDYLVPGLILVVVLGVFPLIVVYGLWSRHTWSWHAALMVGLALVVWIVVQILIIGYSSRPPLQLIYGLLGIVILALALLPPTRRYFLGKEQIA